MIGWFTRLIGRGAERIGGGVERPKMASPAGQPADAAYREGMRLYAAGNWDAAADRFEAAILQKHDWAKAHQRLGECRLRQSRYEEARDALVMSLCFDPVASSVRLALAVSERALDRADESLATLEALLADEPSYANAHYLQGTLLLQRGDLTRAVTSFERAVAADPMHADAHNDLGYLLFRDLGEYERGASHIERALTLQPGNHAAQCNHTMVLSQCGDHEGALALCDRLLTDAPDLQEARLNRALVLLKLGRFVPGWDDYEARKQVRSHYMQRMLFWPEWQGEDLDGKTILVYGEQGLGDEIMFASCFEEVIARAGHTVIECAPRLQRLFQRSFPRATVFTGRQTAEAPGWLEEAPPIDLQSPAGSLPRYLRRYRSDFPMHGGYLVPDPQRVRFWCAQLEALGAGLKVGVSWRGGVRSTRRSLRSIELSNLTPLLGLAGARFVDLQYGDTSEDRVRLSAAGLNIARWPEAIDDLDESAALIAGLDLVVSVCTATIHLAGALGRETWVMVPSVPEWRYQAQGETMPWYPSVRLFRQVGDDWSDLVGSMSCRLADRIALTRR